jgi:hypothetical protein
MLHHEQRVPRALELIECLQQRLGVRRMEARGGLVEHIHHAEQVGAHLGGEPQPLELAGRERRRAALEREVAQSELGEDLDSRQQILGDPLGDQRLLRVLARQLRRPRRRPVRGGPQDARNALQRQPGELSDVEPREGDGQGLATQPLALAESALPAHHVPRHALLHQRALRRGEGLQHVALRTGEGPHVARGLLALERTARLRRSEARVDRDRRLLVREEDPVPVLLGEVTPGTVHVVAERHQDVAQVLAVPRGRPRGDRALADGQRVIRHHRLLGHLVGAAQAMAVGAGARRGVGRERIGVEVRLTGRIGSGARVQQAQGVGDRGHAAHRRAGGGSAAVLLEGHRRGQAVDRVELGDARLVDQPPRVWGHGFEVPPLRLRVERPEGQRGLARAGDTREDDQGVTGQLDVHVLQVVLTGPTHPDESRPRVAWSPWKVMTAILGHAHPRKAGDLLLAECGAGGNEGKGGLPARVPRLPPRTPGLDPLSSEA